MRTITVTLNDGTVHKGMRLYSTDNGGDRGLNFMFIGGDTDRVYANEYDIESLEWIDSPPTGWDEG